MKPLSLLIEDTLSPREAKLATHPKSAYNYAFKIIKGRWEPGEKAILTSPFYAMKYALFIMKGEWPEAEPIIRKNDRYWDMYSNEDKNIDIAIADYKDESGMTEEILKIAKKLGIKTTELSDLLEGCDSMGDILDTACDYLNEKGMSTLEINVGDDMYYLYIGKDDYSEEDLKAYTWP